MGVVADEVVGLAVVSDGGEEERPAAEARQTVGQVAAHAAVRLADAAAVRAGVRLFPSTTTTTKKNKTKNESLSTRRGLLICAIRWR